MGLIDLFRKYKLITIGTLVMLYALFFLDLDSSMLIYIFGLVLCMMSVVVTISENLLKRIEKLEELYAVHEEDKEEN